MKTAICRFRLSNYRVFRAKAFSFLQLPSRVIGQLICIFHEIRRHLKIIAMNIKKLLRETLIKIISSLAPDPPSSSSRLFPHEPPIYRKRAKHVGTSKSIHHIYFQICSEPFKTTQWQTITLFSVVPRSSVSGS